ncbi:MAG: chorismate synthase [Bacteroidetes bacterium]|nr:chorismate synthase [Bacteroidota bacterium]
MAGNSFGTLFKITTFGESHGAGVGVVIDGCPPALTIDLNQIQEELDKRKPGQSTISSPRSEDDTFDILSGLFEGKTTAAPLCIFIKNKDSKPEDYALLKDVYRPSHADYTYDIKYGWRDHRGGGRSSARETAARVAAGSVAKQILKTQEISVTAFTSQIGDLSLKSDILHQDLSQIHENDVKCPDSDLAEKMKTLIENTKEEGDSLGGVVSCVIKNCPAGLGEPVFDRLEADLAKAMLSINATKGFEIGLGFKAAGMKGSEHNDQFILSQDKEIFMDKNNAGGVLGGISTGDHIYFNTAFKPTSTIAFNKTLITKNKEEIVLENLKGRHDPCIVPRAVAVVEAMAAIVIADHFLRNKSVQL